MCRHNPDLYDKFPTSDSVITTGGCCIHGVFKNRIDLPVDVYQYSAAVPLTSQQQFYNEAARQEETCECA